MQVRVNALSCKTIHSEAFCIKGTLKNFPNFTVTLLCQQRTPSGDCFWSWKWMYVLNLFKVPRNNTKRKSSMSFCWITSNFRSFVPILCIFFHQIKNTLKEQSESIYNNQDGIKLVECKTPEALVHRCSSK